MGRPVAAQSSLTGRCTKGFVAFDLENNRLCFVKDYWRPLAQLVHPEWEVYIRLKEHNVRCVATAIAGGDVGAPNNPQVTVTDQHFQGDPNSFSVGRVHCRLVTKEVGRTLDTYRDSGHLMSVTYHALIGM